MTEPEAGVIDRWRRFVAVVRNELLPAHGGRLVKSLGDGLLLEFASVTPAVAAARQMQQRVADFNRGCSADTVMQLRIGAHAADVVVDDSTSTAPAATTRGADRAR